MTSICRFKISIFLIFNSFSYVCICAYVGVYHCIPLCDPELRGQSRSCFLLPLGSWGPNTSCQTWWHVPLPTKPSQWPHSEVYQEPVSSPQARFEFWYKFEHKILLHKILLSFTVQWLKLESNCVHPAPLSFLSQVPWYSEAVTNTDNWY